ncbi:MAG: 50S ribosomal protein L9 [Thermodesulfobacteriota bacterium]
MKIILKESVTNLGSFGDVVNVANGYARNYLLPRGVAVEATGGNVRQFEAEREGWEKKERKKKDAAEKVRADVEALSLSFSRKAGVAPEEEETPGKGKEGKEEGKGKKEKKPEKLFGSVTSMDIEAALKENGLEIDKKDILLSEPLKRLGDFTVGVKLHPEVTAELKVSVIKE